MDLEIPESLAASLQGMVGPQTALGLQLEGAGRGTRVVSSQHFDGHSLNLLYQLGRGAGARDLVFQLLALDNLNGEPMRPIPSLELMVPAVVEWLQRDLIDGWLYQRGRDGVLLAWLVHSVRHVKPTEGAGNPYVVVGLLANTLAAAGREPPNDPRLRFTGMTWGLSFYAEDLPGRTLAGLFGDQGFHKECPEFKREYEAQLKHFTELQPRFGTQFSVSESLWTVCEGTRGGLEHHRLPEGTVARCVNDEELLQRRFDLAADPHWWRSNGCATGFDRIPQHCYLHLFHLDWHRNVFVHAQHAKAYAYQPRMRESLVLPPAHHDLVDILIADRNFLVEDIVPGKAGGTTILCRGAPGLGKTLTAEVYAEAIGKPLYRVHSGQLGTSAASVEQNLTQILRRAERWDCVLLIDEADVYIRRRDNDLEHNAIVAEFLRTLEYFTGLLFMTTNRVDDIDEAILSRCIAVIDYAPPDAEAARSLWKVLSAQLGVALDDTLADELALAFAGASGRDIKELLKLTGKYCRRKGIAPSAKAFSQCARFRGLGSLCGLAP